MAIPQPEPTLPFLLRWTAFSAIGYATGSTLGFFAGHFLLGNAMTGVLTAGTVGYAQFLALRRITAKPGLWVLAGMIVLFPILIIYGLMIDALGYPSDFGWPHGTIGWSIAFLFGGAAIGFAQSSVLALRRSTTISWVITCAIGWSFSALGSAVRFQAPTSSGTLLAFLAFLVAPLVAGTILGVITGGSIVWQRKTRRAS